jgi:acetyl-CoA acetyltransferase
MPSQSDALILGGARTPIGRYGCVGICVGSGQGVALVIEREAG